jgi:hypothetical protein
MKSGQMFWGFFLLTLGALFLLVKYDVIISTFEFVWDIWPLIFVFWGAMVIFKNTIGRPIINAIFGIFLALLLYGFLHNVFWGFDCNTDFNDNDSYTERYNQDYENDIKEANLQIHSGVGYFSIKESTDLLVDAKARGIFGEYDFNYDKVDSIANIDFTLHKNNFNFIKGNFRNQLIIKLNPKPLWNLELETGASKSNFDLSQFRMHDINVQTGATSTRIKLGEKSERVKVDISMGAASFTLEIPKNIGCEIQSDMALVAKHFDGFNKEEDGRYLTENFNNSSKKIFINVEGGVSSFRVVRY